MFYSIDDAIKFLKSQEKIVIPSKFTYWCHSSQVQTTKNSDNYKFQKLWKELPTTEIMVKREMSFLSKRDRLNYVREHQSFDYAPTAYAGVEGQQNFQIKVMMPRMNLSQEDLETLGKDSAYKSKLSYEYRGLGDGRHPKLPHKTRVCVFGFMDHDEMSGKEIPTIFGVREQDAIAYATEVQKELTELSKNGVVSDSKYAMPDFNEGVIENKETFVLGNNQYLQKIKNAPSQNENEAGPQM